MENVRTYWNTNSLLKPGDKYIQIEFNNAAPKLIVTRRSGELLEGHLITTSEACLECDNLELVMDEIKRLGEEAVHQGYHAYFFPVHGKDLPKQLDC